jgi:hypothetical protein
MTRARRRLHTVAAHDLAAAAALVTMSERATRPLHPALAVRALRGPWLTRHAGAAAAGTGRPRGAHMNRRYAMPTARHRPSGRPLLVAALCAAALVAAFEHLERFARAPGARHLPAWKRFNQRLKRSGDVGIWHATYLVRAGHYEAIYGDLSRIGLAAACRHVPIAHKGHTAARHIGHRDDNAPAARTNSRPRRIYAR